MPDNYLGEIMLFPGTFVPENFLPCDGRSLPIGEYTALYSLIGSTYGGDDRTIFSLPDLRGRVPANANYSDPYFRPLGLRNGVDQVMLAPSQLPAHSHTPTVSWEVSQVASTDNGDIVNPTHGSYLSAGFYDGDGVDYDVEIYTPSQPNTMLANGVLEAQAATTIAGQSQPHNNMQPYLVMNFCICTDGVYPPRPS